MAAPAKKKIGVLALQGDFEAHSKALLRVGAEPVEVRSAADLQKIDGLVIPGGESSTMLKLLEIENLLEPLREFGRRSPIFGTCAGAILLATEVINPSQASLGLMDIAVERNAYGRQLDSFIGEVSAPALGDPMPALFIRAPRIRRVGPGVEVLGKHGGEPVLVRQDNVVAATFHPELTTDRRLHRMLFSELHARRSA
jgi:pyridoxal 5'-phosphate synthase pdxT subunit